MINYELEVRIVQVKYHPMGIGTPKDIKSKAATTPEITHRNPPDTYHRRRCFIVSNPPGTFRLNLRKEILAANRRPIPLPVPAHLKLHSYS